MTTVPGDACNLLADYARDRLASGVDPTASLERARPYCAQAKAETGGIADARGAVGGFELAHGALRAHTARDPLPDWHDAELDMQAALALQARRGDLRADLVELLTTRARYLAAHGQPFAADLSRALAEARRAAHDTPDDPAAQRALATAALAAGSLRDRRAITDGLAAGRRAIERKPDDVRAMVLVLELEWCERKPDPDLLARAHAVNPHHPRLALIAAAYQRQAGDVAGARRNKQR
jgi:hypothetical protein